jgi:exopolysaccharide biosynthesis polyprenyl glycosylphosphotransferase
MTQNRRETLILFIGDVLIFLAALYFALWLRNFALPSNAIFLAHLKPFSILIAVWLFVLFIAGLYEKHTLILKNRLPNTILNAQAANSFIAVLFFYFIPYFKITPKTILFIYILASFAMLVLWRLYGLKASHNTLREKGILIGSGDEMRELKEEVNGNPRYNLQFVSSIDLDVIDSLDFQEEVLKMIYSENIQLIVIDMKNEKVEPILPQLYNLIFSKVRFIDMYKIYEDIFDRVPLSLVRYNWFLENISTEIRTTYDALKRLMDIVLSFIAGTISLIVYPFVYLAIKMDDGGKIFFTQERVGKNNKVMRVWKFRSMSEKESNKITRVGKWLRALRIDELPQLWNVFVGDMSVIGPRPEIPALVKHYEDEIPYYDIRHLIKPGLSGWAQLYHTDPPKVTADSDKTKRKLSYDLYYIKNRSIMLDLKIALKTIKTVMSKSGV